MVLKSEMVVDDVKVELQSWIVGQEETEDDLEKRDNAADFGQNVEDVVGRAFYVNTFSSKFVIFNVHSGGSWVRLNSSAGVDF